MNILKIKIITQYKNILIVSISIKETEMLKKIKIEDFKFFLSLLRTVVKYGNRRTMFKDLLKIFIWFNEHSITI